MIVMSPSLGVWLSRGMYCLTARCSTASCDVEVALAYCLMCWHSMVCSLISKTEDIMMAKGLMGEVSRKADETPFK